MLQILAPTDLPSEDEALREPVRAFLAQALAGVPSDIRAKSWQGFDPAFSKALGARGWIGLTLPLVYGGGGRSPFARFVLLEELLAVGAPVAAHWIADRQSAPLLVRFGTEEQRLRYIPGICRGETYFCIGMSEPGTGSDLASVRTKAECTNRGWRLSGSKIWTTNANHAHYMIALARSSGRPEDRHKGLSQFIVDLGLPGVTIRPIVDLVGDAHFCEVHFDDVLLAEDALVGTEGKGWEQVVAELALERSGPERIYSSIVLLDAWIERLRSTALDAMTSIALGRMIGELTVLRSMSIAVTARLAAGESPTVEASLIKDLGTSFEQRVPVLIGEIVGLHPEVEMDPVFRRTLDYIGSVSPSFSLRGGTREILRGIIAKGIISQGSAR
jgi:alkylation response protein AidB-like acyl-CoA dehydrogenase